MRTPTPAQRAAYSRELSKQLRYAVSHLDTDGHLSELLVVPAKAKFLEALSAWEAAGDERSRTRLWISYCDALIAHARAARAGLHLEMQRLDADAPE